MEVRKSITIEAPPESVWKFLSNPEMILEWYLPLRRFEYTSDLRQTVGAPFIFEEESAGRSFTLECEITEWTEPERIAFEMRSGQMASAYRETWTLRRTGAGSEFTLDLQYEFANPALRIISPFIARSSRANVERMLDKLKSLAET